MNFRKISIMIMIVFVVFLVISIKIKTNSRNLYTFNFNMDLEFDDQDIVIEPSFMDSLISNEDVKINEDEHNIQQILYQLKQDKPIRSNKSVIEGLQIVKMALSQLYYYPDDYQGSYYSKIRPDANTEREPIREKPELEDNGEILKYTGNIPMPWCSEFVSWCYKRAGCQMDGIREVDPWILYSVNEITNYFKHNKTWVLASELPIDVTPLPGDYVSVNDGNHSVLVWEISNNNLHVIDGNDCDRVGDYWIYDYRNNSEVQGYGLRYGYQRVLSHGDRVQPGMTINGLDSVDHKRLTDGKLNKSVSITKDNHDKSKINIRFDEPFTFRQVKLAWGKNRPTSVKLSFNNYDSLINPIMTKSFSIDEDEFYTSIYLRPREAKDVWLEFTYADDCNSIDLKELLIVD